MRTFSQGVHNKKNRRLTWNLQSRYILQTTYKSANVGVFRTLRSEYDLERMSYRRRIGDKAGLAQMRAGHECPSFVPP
jgi:hypothetical protein